MVSLAWFLFAYCRKERSSKPASVRHQIWSDEGAPIMPLPEYY